MPEQVAQKFLFEEFQATFIETASKVELSKGVEEMRSNVNLVNIMETLQYYELPDKVLTKNLGEFREHVPLMNDYLDVFFKLSGISKDTVDACLIEEMGDFYSKHKTLSAKTRVQQSHY